MPIKAENKARYPDNWKQISERIRFERAGNRCEWCGAENHKTHPVTGGKVTLTVAHYPDPDPANCSEDNLHALCNKCHNAADAPMRAMNRIRNRNAELEAAGQLRLFE